MSQQNEMHRPPIPEDGIILKNLAKEEILSIYSTHSIRHFPADERKPVSSIEQMAEKGIYSGYGLYASGQWNTTPCQAPFSAGPAGALLGYAFFAHLPDQGIGLLDYFAIMEAYRSLGIGSLFLKYMKSIPKLRDGFLIESEDPDWAKDDSELSVRSKRLAFYERNGALPTGLRASAFGVPYRLLFFPLQGNSLPSTEILRSGYCNIYRHMVSPYHYKTQIHI